MVKTITIRDEVYKKLLTVKRKDESFSELFERLVEGKSPTETLVKLRGSSEFREKEKWFLTSTLQGLNVEYDCNRHRRVD